MNPFLESQKYFKTPLQQLQFFDKYSRWDDKINRRETWIETVDRTVNYLKELSQNKLLENEYELIRQHILEMKVMPSMRLLAMAGSAAKRNNICLYNCSFMGIDSIDCFHEALLISMCGCGVGFSVESKYINQLPYLPATLDYGFTTYDIEDTTEGWVDSIKILFGNLYNGIIPHFDYSHIRKAGTPLKTKGGRASGPEILKETVEFIIDTFLENYEPLFGGGWTRTKNLQLKPIQVHDIMCSIGNCAISGGTRRSAMISLFDFDNEEMLHAKDTDNIKYRWNSNNSAVWDHDLTKEEFDKFIQVVFDSNRGEPGIFNLYGVQNYQQELAPRRISSKISGVNPCQPEFATVLTPEGIKTFKDIDIGSIIWSGKRWTKVVNKVCTGIKPVYKYDSSFGSFIGTENHRVFENGKRIAIKDAKKIDACAGPFEFTKLNPQDIMDGLVIGDGGIHKGSNNLVLLYIGDKDQEYHNSEISHLILKHRPGINPKTWEIQTTIQASELPLTYLRDIPARFYEGDISKRAGFLRGLFTANGSIAGDRVTLKQSSYSLIKSAQTMLSSIGIRSYVTVNKPARTQFKNGIYESRESYTLNISSDKYLFMDLVGFIQSYKTPKNSVNPTKTVSGIIQNTTYLGEYLVYDITVEADEHSYWTGGLLVSNCGEIQLRSNQFCNLTSVIARPDDTKESLLIKIQVASLIGTIQSMATYFPGLRNIWKYNCEEERLLGVDLNGQMDCPILLNDDGKFREHLRETAILTNQIYAKKLGINQSTAVTAVKPNGNSGVLVDAASGLHPRYAKYYIRNVRVDVTSPLYRILFESGAPISPENGQDWSNLRTAVVSFPVKAPDNCITRHDLTAVELAEFWKLNKVYYTEHNPSVTIYYDEHEKEELSNWLWENRNILGGITVLPKDNSNYKLMPYEEITEEEYYKRLKELPEINWSKLEEYELEDMTKATHELSCVSGHCEL